MKRDEKIFLSLGAIILLSSFTKMTYKNILNTFIPSLEGFSPVPKWDYKQWTWGYGTRVPGSIDDPKIKPTGTITREQAFEDTMKHIEADKRYLEKLIKVPLKPNQWAALLSFSYNLGRHNADNLVKNINARDNEALKRQWMKYVNAGGEKQEGLVIRRGKEWQLWSQG